MQLQVQDIIFLAMSECGAVRINEAPAPYELSRGIQIANIMLDAWSGERLMLRTTIQESGQLTAGVSSYAIGSTSPATETATTIAFVASTPPTITDSAAGFSAAGFKAGQILTISGTTGGLNNGSSFQILSVTAGVISLAAGSLVSQAAGPSVTLTGTNPFNTARPISIVGAFIRDNYGIDTPVEIVSRDRFDSYPDKSISNARPISLFYDPGVAQQSSPATGTIWVYYTPDSYTPYTLYIDEDKYLTEFVNATDIVTFEPLYYNALVSNLAVKMFRHFHGPKVPIPVDMADMAASAKRQIMSLNSHPITAGMDIPGKAIGIYNIYTGNVNEF